MSDSRRPVGPQRTSARQTPVSRKPTPATAAKAAARPAAKRGTAKRVAAKTATGSGARGAAKPTPAGATKAPASAKPLRRSSDRLVAGLGARLDSQGRVRDEGRLRGALLGPLGLGALIIVAVLGLLTVAGHALGPALIFAVLAAGVAMSAALVFAVGWIVETAVARPLARVRAALQQIEEGDYDARLDPQGAHELCEVAHGFNRMVTIVQHQRERLKILADTDALTGLANHRHFYELLRAELQTARDEGTPLAIVALDIDGFKKLNDTRGHSHGDETLRDAASALERAIRDSDVVARTGGDDFMLMLRNAAPGYAREAANRARDAIQRGLPEDPPLTASAGFVCFPEQGTDDTNLGELAIEALGVAKRNGGDQTRKYDPDQVATIPTVKQQRAEVDALLDAHVPLVSVFQPLVELATGRIVGYEALSRFTGEFARSPDAWFNQAQRCGRGLQLESLAIQAALSVADRPQGTYLSLNFSPSVIASSQIVHLLPRRLNDVVIEITEHELAASDGGLEEGLARLRARGARIAVDDAGAGYAGLNQVMRVQPDLIKLDRSLVESVHAEPAKAALIEFFVMFARRVGAAVCTEGIETLEELRALINLGVTYGQGYLLGRPADPWTGISEEIFRALATGSLRTHAQPVRQLPPQQAAALGPQRETTIVGAPVNRRLTRYRHR